MRKILRQILKWLVIKTLDKHKPFIIFIKGNKHGSIISEFFYKVSSKYNPRQNLERTEREFSIPLTILGHLYYPNSYFDWIKLLIKSFLQLFTVVPYKHMLIIQIREITPNIYDFWKTTINPSILINADDFSLEDVNELQQKIISPKIENFLLQLGLTIEEALLSLKNEVMIPSLRLNLEKSGEKGLILDARYFYHPPSIKAVLETTLLFDGAKFLISSSPLNTDFLNLLNNANINLIKPSELNSIKNTDYLLIVWGRKNELQKEIDNFHDR